MYLQQGTHKIDGATVIVNSMNKVSSIKLTSDRKYWIGLRPNNLGWLKSQYYRHRGWLLDNQYGSYIVRPASKTWEWLRCLVSQKHAETTWLRIDSEREQRILDGAKTIVLGLLLATTFTWGVVYGQYRVNQYLQNNNASIVVGDQNQ